MGEKAKSGEKGMGANNKKGEMKYEEIYFKRIYNTLSSYI